MEQHATYAPEVMSYIELYRSLISWYQVINNLFCSFSLPKQVLEKIHKGSKWSIQREATI